MQKISGKCEKIVRVLHRGSARYGFLEGDRVAMASGELQALQRTGEHVPLDECQLLTPLLPNNIFIVAINYSAHPKTPPEAGELPLVAFKPLTSLVRPGGKIVYPSSLSKRVYFEAEVAIVIGKRARNVPQEKASEYILGFTLVNDVTDREHFVNGQLFFSKSHDTFLPMGPVLLVTQDCSDVTVKGYLNGKLVQDGSWEHLIYSPEKLIEILSRFMTLMPGDVICVGTPDGSGELHVGDTFTVQNEFIGELTNCVVDEADCGKEEGEKEKIPL